MKKLAKKYAGGFVIVVFTLMLFLGKEGYVSTTIAISVAMVVSAVGFIAILSLGRMWIECPKCRFREEVKNDPSLHLAKARVCPVCGGECIVVDDYIAGG